MLLFRPRLTCALVCALALGADPASAISGVCPDGSIFIVQRAEAIPCRNAKEVEPADIPPLNPEFLPRPYGWDVFNRETDPNNPYNLIETAPPEGGRPEVARSKPTRPPEVSSAPPTPPTTLAAPRAPIPEPQRATGLELGLSAQDREDLAAIVAALQERAPATLVRPTDGSAEGATLRLARSISFEARVLDALRRAEVPADGRVLALRVDAAEASSFWGTVTFVQGHVAYHPERTNPYQFGLVEGALGTLEPGARVLGYAVLPAHFDLGQPLDIYWDDRRMTARLTP